MSRRVEVMWADHDRARAHELDDLLERWELRRAAQIDFDDPFPFAPDYAAIDYTNPETVNQAVTWRDQLIDRHDAINAWMSNKDQRDAGGRRLAYPEYHKKRAALLAEQQYVLAAKRCLKQWLREFGRLEVTTILEAAREADDGKTFLLCSAFELLKSLVIDGRVEYTTEEQALVDAVDDFLREKHMQSG